MAPATTPTCTPSPTLAVAGRGRLQLGDERRPELGPGDGRRRSSRGGPGDRARCWVRSHAVRSSPSSRSRRPGRTTARAARSTTHPGRPGPHVDGGAEGRRAARPRSPATTRRPATSPGRWAAASTIGPVAGACPSRPRGRCRPAGRCVPSGPSGPVGRGRRGRARRRAASSGRPPQPTAIELEQVDQHAGDHPLRRAGAGPAVPRDPGRRQLVLDEAGVRTVGRPQHAPCGRSGCPVGRRRRRARTARRTSSSASVVETTSTLRSLAGERHRCGAERSPREGGPPPRPRSASAARRREVADDHRPRRLRRRRPAARARAGAAAPGGTRHVVEAAGHAASGRRWPPPPAGRPRRTSRRARSRATSAATRAGSLPRAVRASGVERARVRHPQLAEQVAQRDDRRRVVADGPVQAGRAGQDLLDGEVDDGRRHRLATGRRARSATQQLGQRGTW